MGSRILERLGYTVTAINNSQKALELFKENASSLSDLSFISESENHTRNNISC
jgi:CheY-like chemotaxis protein